MNSINLIIIISIIASISVIMKKYALEYSFFINIALGFIILSYLITYITPILNQIKNLVNLAKISDKYLYILFKSLGICFLTQFASDSCKDSGETSLASKIEMIGKISMITIALPLFNEITETALEFID